VARFIREAGYVPFMVRRAFVAGRCEAIIAYSPPLSLGVAAVLLGWLWRSPTVLWLQDSWSNILEATGAVRSPLLLAGVRLFERVLYRLVSRVVVSGVDMDHVQQFVDPAKAVVIHNWPTVSTNGERRSSTPGEFIALFGGALGLAQDFDVILDAAERLRDGNRSIRVMIAGDGPKRGYIADQVRKRDLRNVILMSSLPPAAYDRLVAQAGCGLVTLKPGVASIPSKITAFLAAGVPVVAALPDGSAATLVEESYGGIRVPTGDPDRFMMAIRVLARNEVLRQNLSVAGQTFVKRHLSPELAFDRWERLLVELVEGQSNARFGGVPWSRPSGRRRSSGVIWTKWRTFSRPSRRLPGG